MKKEGLEFLETLYDILENPLYSKIIGWKNMKNSHQINNNNSSTSINNNGNGNNNGNNESEIEIRNIELFISVFII